MQYYKFPDYRHQDDTKFISAPLYHYHDFDVCSFDSGQIVGCYQQAGLGSSTPINVNIKKIIESETNSEMQFFTYIDTQINSADYKFINLWYKKHTIKIIKYLDGKPSTIAMMVNKTSADENAIIFFSIKGSDDQNIESYIRQIDFEFIEPGLKPTGMYTDIQNNRLYITYDNKIVVLDISDILSINKITEYIINDQNRLNNIKDIAIDPSKNLILCTTNNLYYRYDKIVALYYDPISNSFSRRGEYLAPSADSVSYNTISINNNYIYTNNINSWDVNNQDTQRSKVGLHILKTSDNFQTITKIKSIPFGYYWNDTDMPIDKADLGYKYRDQMMHYRISNIKDNIMYVMVTALNNYVSTSTGLQDYSSGVISSLMMYDISNPEEFSVIGTNTLSFRAINKVDIRDNFPTFDDYKIYLLKDNNTTGEKTFIENGIGNIGNSIVSKVHLIDTSAISLEQEITFDDNIPFDVDYYSESNPNFFGRHAYVLAIANGLSGVQFRYFSPTTNKYELLKQERPIHPSTGEYDDIQKVIIYAPLSISNMHIFCFGKKNIYNYKIDSSSLAISLVQVCPMSTFGITEDVIENRFASFYGGDLSFFVKVGLEI